MERQPRHCAEDEVCETEAKNEGEVREGEGNGLIG